MGERSTPESRSLIRWRVLLSVAFPGKPAVLRLGAMAASDGVLSSRYTLRLSHVRGAIDGAELGVFGLVHACRWHPEDVLWAAPTQFILEAFRHYQKEFCYILTNKRVKREFLIAFVEVEAGLSVEPVHVMGSELWFNKTESHIMDKIEFDGNGP